MQIFRTIALVTILAAGALLWPLVRLWAEPGVLEAAQSALKGGDYPKAVALYTDILQNQRLDPMVLAAVYKERAVARHKSGAAIQAIADYTNAIWLGTLPDPQLARTFLDRGIAYIEIGELMRARRDFDSAIAKDSQLADAFFGRATTLRLLGKPEPALADYTQALTLGHDQAYLVYFGRGLALEALGRREEAVADFRQAALLNPQFGAAQVKLTSLGVAPPSQAEIQARALEDSRQSPPHAPSTPPSPDATIALADAGEVLTMAGSALEDSAPTGALPPGAPRTEAQRPALRAAVPEAAPKDQPAGSVPVPKPSFLRPSQDALLAEHALEANGRAGVSESQGVSESLGAATPQPPSSARAEAAAPKISAEDLADAQAPTGAIPTPTVPPESVSPDTALKPAVLVPPPGSGPEAAAAPVSPPSPDRPQPAKAGRYFLQLGAFSDKALAERGAAGFAARFPSVAATHPASVQASQAGVRGALYRVRIGPFNSEDESRALCNSLKAQEQPCVPVLPSHPVR